jgi:hypothetical protein
LNGHLLEHIPHPIQSGSTMIGYPSPPIFIASISFLTGGQNLMHGIPHLRESHFSLSRTATLKVAKSKHLGYPLRTILHIKLISRR